MLGETREEPVEITAGELPGERLGDSLVAFLKGDEAFAQDLEIGEVVRSEDLALNHREVDLDLLEPGGMSGKVDEPQVGPRSLKAFHRSLPDEKSRCPLSRTPARRRRRAPLSSPHRPTDRRARCRCWVPSARRASPDARPRLPGKSALLFVRTRAPRA